MLAEFVSFFRLYSVLSYFTLISLVVSDASALLCTFAAMDARELWQMEIVNTS